MIHGRYTWTISVVVALALCVLPSLDSYAANPPLCPHVIGWNSQINTWAQGAPWIKVIFANDIAPAKATGAKVVYRPFTADTTYWENGYLPDQRTGATYADLVWAQISGLAQKPEAVTYRNEFDWANATKAKRTCAEFVNYKNRLRELGYTGKVIFGSFSPDWVSASTWQDPDLMAAVKASDGVETHEYFDFLVNCCLPNRCFRHRDIAIANNAYLQGKDWYIGEFGSDVDWGLCKPCGDGQMRTGWRDRNKLTEQQYIDQMKIYRAGCASEVVAVFVFQQGDQSFLVQLRGRGHVRCHLYADHLGSGAGASGRAGKQLVGGRFVRCYGNSQPRGIYHSDGINRQLLLQRSTRNLLRQRKQGWLRDANADWQSSCFQQEHTCQLQPIPYPYHHRRQEATQRIARGSGRCCNGSVPCDRGARYRVRRGLEPHSGTASRLVRAGCGRRQGEPGGHPRHYQRFRALHNRDIPNAHRHSKRESAAAQHACAGRERVGRGTDCRKGLAMGQGRQSSVGTQARRHPESEQPWTSCKGHGEGDFHRQRLLLHQ